MKCSCMLANLSHALAWPSRVATNRTTLPILTHVLLTAADGRLSLKATNLETGVALSFGAVVGEEGAIAVPARVLAEYIHSLSGDIVEMETDNQAMTLHLRCGAFKARLKGIDASEFPALPARGENAVVVSFVAAELAAAIAQVAFAAAKDKARPALQGICAEIATDGVTFAAADGYRLSMKQVAAVLSDSRSMSDSSTDAQSRSIGVAPESPLHVVIPADAMKLVAGMVQDDPVEMSVGERAVLFRAANAELSAQLIAEHYPDVRRIIPQTHDSRAVVARAELLRAVKACTPFVGDKRRVDIAASPGQVEIKALSAQDGTSTTQLDAAVEGDPFQIALQAPYVAEVLNALDSAQVAIEFARDSGQPQPVVIHAVGDASFVHVVMPLVDDWRPAPAESANVST